MSRPRSQTFGPGVVQGVFQGVVQACQAKVANFWGRVSSCRPGCLPWASSRGVRPRSRTLAVEGLCCVWLSSRVSPSGYIRYVSSRVSSRALSRMPGQGRKRASSAMMLSSVVRVGVVRGTRSRSFGPGVVKASSGCGQGRCRTGTKSPALGPGPCRLSSRASQTFGPGAGRRTFGPLLSGYASSRVSSRVWSPAVVRAQSRSVAQRRESKKIKDESQV